MRTTVKAGSVLVWGLNVLSVVFITFTSASIISRYVKTPRQEKPLLQLGDVVPVSGIDWQKNPQTLVFALSVSCRFCTDSAPFYKALLDKRQVGNWQAVAVLPQPVDTAKAYMEAHDYSLPEVRQVDLGAIGVSGTPTLLLVDQSGRLKQQWIGALTSVDEADVAAHLGISAWPASDGGPKVGGERVSAEQSPLVTTSQLLAMLRRGDAFNLLDVRERSAAAKGRVSFAVNIPADELSVRAPHEVLLGAPTVLYCSFSAACAANGIPSLCSRSTEILNDIGITQVRVLRDPLLLLEEAGVPVTRDAVGNLKR